MIKRGLIGKLFFILLVIIAFICTLTRDAVPGDIENKNFNAGMRIVDFKKIIEKSICNNMDFTDEWNNLWQREGLIFPEMFNDRDTFSRNSVLMPLGEELFLLFYRINKGDILVSLSNKPEGSWKESGIQLFTRKFNWEQERIGISTPPIQIIDNKKQKALLFYHGVKENSANGKIMKIYSLGAFFMSSEIKHNKLLLKIERIIKPVLSPLKEYEINNKWLLKCVFKWGVWIII